MAMKGTTLKDLKKLADKSGSDYARMIRVLKLGEHPRGWKWKFNESKGGKVSIFDVKKKSK